MCEAAPSSQTCKDLDSSSDEEDEYDYEKIRLKHDLTWVFAVSGEPFFSQTE